MPRQPVLIGLITLAATLTAQPAMACVNAMHESSSAAHSWASSLALVVALGITAVLTFMACRERRKRRKGMLLFALGGVFIACFIWVVFLSMGPKEQLVAKKPDPYHTAQIAQGVNAYHAIHGQLPGGPGFTYSSQEGVGRGENCALQKKIESGAVDLREVDPSTPEGKQEAEFLESLGVDLAGPLFHGTQVIYTTNSERGQEARAELRIVREAVSFEDDAESSGCEVQTFDLSHDEYSGTFLLHKRINF